MLDSYSQDAIAAIATPPGEGGIGIIRISGPEAPHIAERVWQGGRAVADFETHKLYYGEIIDMSESERSGLATNGSERGRLHPAVPVEGATLAPMIDKCLIVWMKAPHSYTGEEVIEIQTHGGASLLEEILQVILKCGARLAKPGEFTERAFLNGRMDLAQAEAVADLIQGRSELALELARSQLTGRLSGETSRFRQELISMRAQVEAMIDHPDEEEVNELRHEGIAQRVGEISNQIQNWLLLYDEGRRMREGVRVVLVGRPNVGKSSLLNCLLNDDRAIVHIEAGTTRDVVSETVQMGGLLVRLCDTAGLREGEGEVESEGVRRSWQEVERADIILFVIDRSEPLTDEDIKLYEEVRAKPHLVLFNKCDLQEAQDFSDSGLMGEWVARGNVLAPPCGDKTLSKSTGPIKRNDQESRQFSLVISAKTEEGIPALKDAITALALPHGKLCDQVYIANMRHKICLERTFHALNEAKKSAETDAGLELIAADLMAATNHMGEITGEIVHEEILSEIFSRFCLGK